MHQSILLVTFMFCAVASSESQVAQAATGGTNDTAVPTMVVPIRPRDEPVGSTAVPNVYRTYPPASQSPNIRLRRIRPIMPNSSRSK